MTMLDHAVCFQFKAQNFKYSACKAFHYYCPQVKDLFFLPLKNSNDATKIKLMMGK